MLWPGAGGGAAGSDKVASVNFGRRPGTSSLDRLHRQRVAQHEGDAFGGRTDPRAITT